MLSFKFPNFRVPRSTQRIDLIVVRDIEPGVAASSLPAASCNILLSGSDIFLPSAEQYNGIKLPVNFAAGEVGEKTVSLSIEPSSFLIEYFAATIDDVFGDEVSPLRSKSYVGISTNINDLKFDSGVIGIGLPENIDLRDIKLKAPIESPSFQGIPTVPTPLANAIGNQIPNIAWVEGNTASTEDLTAINASITNLQTNKAPINSPNLTGTPLTATPAPTANGKEIVNAEFVNTKLNTTTTIGGVDLTQVKADIIDLKSNKAPTASPVLTGIPKVPTPTVSAVPEQITNVGYVNSQIANATGSTSTIGTDLTALKNRVTAVETTKAPLASPTFTGSPKAPTPAVTATGEEIATAKFVTDKDTAQIALNDSKYAPKDSPTFTGNPRSVTPTIASAPEQIATVGWVKGQISSGTGTNTADIEALEARVTLVETTKAGLASPAFTGSPIAPTPLLTSNDGAIATTKFVGDKLAAKSTADDTKYAPINNPKLTGIPEAPQPGATPVATQIATVKYVQDRIAATPSTVPSGAMMEYGGDTAPAGWLLCDGASISTATFASLFAAIGYKYGGSGANFNVPDRRGKVSVGAGTGYAVGATGGANSYALTGANLAPHNHNINDPGHGHGFNDPGHVHGLNDPGHGHPVNDPGHIHELPIYNEGGNSNPGRDFDNSGNEILGTGSVLTGITILGASTNIGVLGNPTGITMVGAGTGASVVAGGTGITTENAGSGNAFSLMQEYCVSNVIIKI